MGWKILLFALLFFFPCAVAPAQTGEQKDESSILAVVKDAQGDFLEGYLRVQPEEVTVSSRDNQEKKISSKYIKSITLERIREDGPASIDPKQEARYSVRLENSQEVYTLRKKYTFSLNTNLGLVTKTIDPETINSILTRDASPTVTQKSDRDRSFIQDKSIVFSLEFKF